MLGMSESKIRVESYDPKTKLIKIKPEKSFDFKKDSEFNGLNVTKFILAVSERFTARSSPFFLFKKEETSIMKAIKVADGKVIFSKSRRIRILSTLAKFKID